MEITSANRVQLLWAPNVVPVSRDQAAETREIITALKALNKTELFGDGQELTFLLDRDTQRPIIQLIDRESREVVRQIPPEYVLRAAEELRSNLRRSSPTSGDESGSSPKGEKNGD